MYALVPVVALFMDSLERTSNLDLHFRPTLVAYLERTSKSELTLEHRSVTRWVEHLPQWLLIQVLVYHVYTSPVRSLPTHRTPLIMTY